MVEGNAYKLNAVRMWMLLDKLVDGSMVHPLGNHCKLVFTDRHPKKWQDIGVPEVLPGDCLSVGSLQSIHSDEPNGTRDGLTLRTPPRSLVYMRTTLMAT